MSLLRKNLYYFWKKTSERQFRKGFALANYKPDLERFRTCDNLKPAAQIKSEMKTLQSYWDCFPYQYYRFDFFRNDCTVTLEEMKKYVPYFFMHRLFYPHSYKEYGILSDDKDITFAMLKTYNIAQPKMLFGFDGKDLYDTSNSPVKDEYIEEIISGSTAAKIFVKPRFGLGGKGIVVFKNDGTRFVNEQGRTLDPGFFRDELKGNLYIVQEGLVQHQEMNKLYPHSINTFRIVTECIDGKTRVLYALVRMGRGGKQVDNASSGGIYIKIDSETGQLGDFAFGNNRITTDVHPDTGFVFKGAKIGCWDEAKRFILEAAHKFRSIKYIGWDVAFSEDGPAIIEINKRPDIGLIQDCYGGMRDDFNITPKDWWYKSNYTIKDL